jgi:hypothetical protein
VRLIAIDWSGMLAGAQRTIWLAEVAEGRLIRLQNARSREEIADHLIREAEHDPGLVVGFDFAFSLSVWFLDARGFSRAADLWEWVTDEGERWLAACDPPLWGRPGRRRPELPEHFRLTERLVPPTAGIRPKSVFQIGGAGAVGTGSLRGMPILRRLHRSGFSIWPFDPPGWPRVVEIYPRLLTGEVSKKRRERRAEYLAGRFPGLDERIRRSAEGSDDALDALVSALVMADHAADLANLPPIEDPRLRREGLIWHPAWRTADAPWDAANQSSHPPTRSS